MRKENARERVQGKRLSKSDSKNMSYIQSLSSVEVVDQGNALALQGALAAPLAATSHKPGPMLLKMPTIHDKKMATASASHLDKVAKKHDCGANSTSDIVTGSGDLL